MTTVAVLVLLAGHVAAPLTADEKGDPAAVPLMRLLESGRLPDERIGSVVELICRRGNEHDLAYVYRRALEPDGFPPDVRRDVFAWLAEAARSRRVKPHGDLSDLGALIQQRSSHNGSGPAPEKGLSPSRSIAVELAGLWEVESLADDLRTLALSDQVESRLRRKAIGALVRIGGATARRTVEELTEAGHLQSIRYLAVAALADLDLEKAAETAPEVLEDGTADDDPGPMIAAFLDHRGGSDKLAEALRGRDVPADAAKLALRYMYSVGRSDEGLSAALSEAAGIGTGTTQLSKEEIERLAAEVLASGDPARGERVFRRADLSCMKCHSISKAGGDIGPDLSAVGSSSPVDYILKSILFPNQAVKEQYQASVIVTAAGKILTGIIADRNDQRIVLKEATGEERIISSSDVVLERDGKSLMPQGLTKFLTRRELIDLVRFLSELGKPGAYAIRKRPTIQRWRVMKDVPQELAIAVPDGELFRQKVLGSDPSRWEPAYGKVSGMLPAGALLPIAGSAVVYAQGEVQVTVSGKVGFEIDGPDGNAGLSQAASGEMPEPSSKTVHEAVRAWVNEQSFGHSRRFVTELPSGRHKITLRIDTSGLEKPAVRVEVFKPQGSSGEFTVVAGK